MRDGANWYVYCDNHPLNYFDPNGLKKSSSVFFGIWREDYSRTDYTSLNRTMTDSNAFDYYWNKYHTKGEESKNYKSDMILTGSGVASLIVGLPELAVPLGLLEMAKLTKDHYSKEKDNEVILAAKALSFNLYKSEFEFNSYKLGGYTDIGQEEWYITSSRKEVRCYFEADGQKYRIDPLLYELLFNYSKGDDTRVKE